MNQKTVIITGANGALGTTVTRKLLDSGYRVVATVIDAAGLNEQIPHPNLDSRVVNLTNESETAIFVESVIQQYGPVHAALLLVGGFAMGNISATVSAELDHQINLNFKTAYHITRPLFIQMMKQNNGRLVFIGARPALVPTAGKDLLAYSLSKSLLFRLAELLNEEANGKNIVATVVVPSIIDTPANRKNMPGVDPRRWVQPSQLAEVLEFIISDGAGALRETVLKVYNNA